MASRKRMISKIREHPLWWGVIGSLIATVIASAFGAFFTDWKTVWKFAWGIVTTVWGWIVYPVPVPAIILLAICLVAVIPILVVVRRLRASPAPKWHDYRSDEVFGIVWKWTYLRSGE